MFLQKFFGLSEYHYFFKDHWVKWSLFLLAVSHVCLWLVTWYVIIGLPEYAALQTTVYFGISFFGEAVLLWHLPLLGVLFGVLNLILASRVYPSYRWLAQYILICTILWQWLLLAAAWWIYLLNKI